jgi:hypothetical protein
MSITYTPMNTITLLPIKYGEWNPDGTHSTYILKKPHMYWEDELQEQKAERDFRRNGWKSILILTGGAIMLSGVLVPKNWTDVIAMIVGSLNCRVPVAMPPQTQLG